jgi:hypothetical protein
MGAANLVATFSGANNHGFQLGHNAGSVPNTINETNAGRALSKRAMYCAEADQLLWLQETLRSDSRLLKRHRSMLPDETTIHCACLARELTCYRISEAD